MCWKILPPFSTRNEFNQLIDPTPAIALHYLHLTRCALPIVMDGSETQGFCLSLFEFCREDSAFAAPRLQGGLSFQVPIFWEGEVKPHFGMLTQPSGRKVSWAAYDLAAMRPQH